MSQAPFLPKNSSWCPLPWKGINIRNNGDFRVCCNANVSQNKGILLDPQGLAYNARSAALNEVRNSGLLKEIRKAMLQGERHESCRRCNVEDDSGIPSRRAFENEYWKADFAFEQAVHCTSDDGAIAADETHIGYLDVRFGNLCNLKCRMCGPTDSSFWYKEHFETLGPKFRESSGQVELERRDGRVRVQGQNPYGWHEAPLFWQQLEENLHDIRKIYCVGGEPLLIERHYELLRKLVDAGRSKQVILEYNSNVTVLPPQAIELWKSFKEVRIGASVDGYGRINDFIRHPSIWSQIEKNLERLDLMEGNIKIWLTTTVQAYNIYYLPELLKWKIQRNFSRIGANAKSPFVKTHPLHAPSYFSVQVLPAEAKKMVAEKFDHFYQDWFLPRVGDIEPRFGSRESLMSAMQRLLAGYRTLMFKEDLSGQLPKFIEATERMDLARGERWSEVMPEIAEPILRKLADFAVDREEGQLELSSN